MVFLGIPVLLIGIGTALIVTTAVGAIALHTYYHTALVVLTIVQGVIFAPAVFYVWRWRPEPAVSARWTLLFILGVAILLRAMPLFSLPHSTDIYRYVWDGRVQGAGINPYLHIPADPALEHLRDPIIFEGINRKEYARTIYPPAAQIVFLAATRFGETLTIVKLAMLAFEALAIWAVLALLAARGLPSILILAFAWHPLSVWEVSGSGHLDIVAVALMILAILAAERKRLAVAGATLALATCVKFFPLVIAPALWRRWDWKMPALFLATATALYLPYLSAGGEVFGFLGGYAGEGGLNTGYGFLFPAIMLRLGFADVAMPVFIACALMVLGTLAWRAAFRAQPEKPDLRAAFILVAAFTVLVSPHHAWYLLWLIPFLCFFPSAAVLYLTLAAVALYRVGWPPSLMGAAFLYVPFFLLLLIENSRLFAVKEISDERLRV
jgi:alpha-1,6-mannosyltransferase